MIKRSFGYLNQKFEAFKDRLIAGHNSKAEFATVLGSTALLCACLSFGVLIGGEEIIEHGIKIGLDGLRHTNYLELGTGGLEVIGGTAVVGVGLLGNMAATNLGMTAIYEDPKPRPGPQ